jgi:hypothetical protein
MYRPAAFFIDIDRPWKSALEGDELYSDLQRHLIQQQSRIGLAWFSELCAQPLQRHPTNPMCVYTPWCMVDVAAESASDWETDDHGTGIFPILEKHGFTFGGASELYNVGKKDRMTTLMISFDHQDSSMDWTSKDSPDTSVAKKEYDEMMVKFKKVEELWNDKYPDPTYSGDEFTSDDEEDSENDDEDYEGYGYWNNRSRALPMDEKAKARQILGIMKSNPTQAEIRRAYRKKAKENHPDKGGDKETMKSINSARDILLPNKFKLKF